jgi:Cft2 family RNA processing exonuclease
VIVGKIVEILDSSHEEGTIVVIDQFQVGKTRHPTFQMPTLIHEINKTSLLIVPVSVRSFITLLSLNNELTVT